MTTIAKQMTSALRPEIVDTRFQTAMRVRPHSVTVDANGLVFEPGALQARDLQLAQEAFEHKYFVGYAFRMNRPLWMDSEMRIFQIQTPLKEGGIRVAGTIVTDEDRNLVRYCVDDKRHSNRAVMRACVDLICTVESILHYNPA